MHAKNICSTGHVTSYWLRLIVLHCTFCATNAKPQQKMEYRESDPKTITTNEEKKVLYLKAVRSFNKEIRPEATPQH
jgi:hypothetical protein